MALTLLGPQSVLDCGPHLDIVTLNIQLVTKLFSITGYGNLSPSTWEAQLFCIFYAIFGIPLCLVVLTGMGERLYKVNKWLADKINCCSNPTLDNMGDCLVILILGVGIFILIPSALFQYMEKWSFQTSVYYSFVTLSTIGFGDYVAGQGEWNKAGWFQVCMYVFLNSI